MLGRTAGIAWGPDLTVLGRMNSQSNTNNWAQAGLMMRASANDGAVFGGIFITPGNGVEFLARAGQSQNATMQADISYSPPSSVRRSG